MKLPVYNCIVNEDTGDESGVYAISFVDSPANETEFVKLSQENDIYLSKDAQKQILTGVVLKPNQLIYRNSQTMGEHYIKFTSEQIEKIAHKMMKTGISLHNTTHQHQSKLTGNYLTELWIIEDTEKDKSNALGFKDLPKGTLMCSYKVQDAEYWNKEVMSGNVRGFSLEGLFFQELEMKKTINQLNNKKDFMTKETEKKKGILGKIAKFFLDIEEVEKDDTTDSGESYREFVLSDGKIVMVDADGFSTMDGEQMQSGEHKLSDGNILVIDEEGNFVETKEASATNTEPDEATAAQTLRRQQHEKAKRQKLEETTVNSEDVQALKDRITELETKLAEAEAALQTARGEAADAKTEVEQLKKTTPSTPPAVQKLEEDTKKMSYTERMAYSIKMKNQNKK